MCRTARRGRGGPDAGRLSVCVGRQVGGRGGPDAGRVYVCVGQQDRGGEDLMQEGYMCV